MKILISHIYSFKKRVSRNVIPENISGSKNKLFTFLKDILQNRVNMWSVQWLSRGEKEVHIKYIVLVLPTYVMSSFLLSI